MQTNAPATGEWVDQFNRAVQYGQVNIDQAGLPKHASTHGTAGSDPISPASIGAASTTHASTHATGGSDAITPASIGTVSFLNASVDINYASIAGSGGFLDSSNITVTGAALNDLVFADCVSIRGSGDGSRPLLFSGFVSATDVVTIRAINPTALAVNPGTYTFKILVTKGI